LKRLGLARAEGDPLWAAVRGAGWEPVPVFVTVMEPTLAPPPLADPDAVLVLSPAAARHGLFPQGVPCLAQGEATARALGERPVQVSASPRAEGLFQLLQERFPAGGDFLLARAERSREPLERAAAGTPWRLRPWVTHRERPLDPLPALPPLAAVLALSPLQAEVLGPLAPCLRLAWGQRTHQAFAQVGYPSHGWCEPRPSALEELLSAQSLP
jgi:uroporphyrinogen-III synthase